MSQIPTISRPARLDRQCAEAVELARAAAEETGEGVGEYLHAEPEADRVVTHFFASTLAGYRGWRWAVVVARAPRSRTVTVNETALLPGPDALKAPEWVPWAERLQAGDVGVGDLLPTDDADTRLMPAYAYSDDDAVEDIAFELGVGRARVMSRDGRIDTAERWYDGEHGPNAEISTSAPPDARCGSCGFYLPLAGSLRQLFGVCGNMYAADDARAVSADHGCGAHSEVLTQIDASGVGMVDHTDTAYDDALVEQIDTGDDADVTETGDGAEATVTEPVADAEPEPVAEPAADDAPAVSEPGATESAPDDAVTAMEPAVESETDVETTPGADQAVSTWSATTTDQPAPVQTETTTDVETPTEVTVTVADDEPVEVVVEEPSPAADATATESAAEPGDTPGPVAESDTPTTGTDESRTATEE